MYFIMFGMELNTGIVLGIIVVICLMIIIAKGKKNDPLKSIPGPKPYPIIGNVYEMVQIEAVDLFLKWTQQYGSILKYNVFLLGTQVMISDADDLKHVLVTNSSNYKKPESLLRPVRKIFGSRAVICLSPKEHAQRRKILNPAFNTTAIRNKVTSIHTNINKLIRTWKSGTLVQVQHDLTRLSLDILGDCVFGYDFDCIDNPDTKLTAALYRLMSVQDMNFMRFLPFYNYLPTRMNSDLQLIRNFVKNVIKNKEKSLKGESATDMLDLMLQSRKINADPSTQTSLTTEDIVDDIILFLIAGHETATNVLCWTLLELARNPDIQERCRDEASEICSMNDFLDYDSCSRLEYTDSCIKEALRLYPPVPLTCRETIKDDTLGGHYIPAGTVIALQLGAMMRNPEYFSEPAKFNPDRFLSHYSPSHFLPFLAGPDMCIGNKLAMLEMKMIIAVLLNKVKFIVPQGAQFKGCQGLTYHLTPPLSLKVEHVEQ